MTIKKFLLLSGLLFSSVASHAQNWVGLSIGGNHTLIDFRNAAGVKNKNLQGIPGFTVSAHFQIPLSKIENLSLNGSTIINLEVGYKTTRIVDGSSSQQASWALNQMTGGATLRKNFKSQSELIPFYELGLSIDYMLRGTQTLGFEQFDLNESLHPTNLSIQSGLGLQYEISYDANATFLLGYLYGISDIEKDTTQKANLNGLRLSIAIYFTIDNTK